MKIRMNEEKHGRRGGCRTFSIGLEGATEGGPGFGEPMEMNNYLETV